MKSNDSCLHLITPPAVQSEDDLSKVWTGCPNLLQLTAATFLVPSALCVAQIKPVGVFVYGGNAVCSVYAHRPDRTAEDSWTDTVDNVMVAIWVGYNCFLLYNLSLQVYQLAIALGCAVVVLGLKIRTKQLDYRSKKRYAVHAAMHLSGSIGSCFLLF